MGRGVPFVRTKGDRSVVGGGFTYLDADRPLTAKPELSERLRVGGRPVTLVPARPPAGRHREMPKKGTPK
jgi:hypothetical protein